MVKSKHDQGGLVYSTEYGRMCPGCNRPVLDCACNKSLAVISSDGVVRIRRETKARHGKVVTVITGIPLDQNGTKQLAKELKSKCGCGGTVKGDVIEIQGDKTEILIEELKNRGWPVKRSGG
jgi:translation initiation factor 1